LALTLTIVLLTQSIESGKDLLDQVFGFSQEEVARLIHRRIVNGNERMLNGKRPLTAKTPKGMMNSE